MHMYMPFATSRHKNKYRLYSLAFLTLIIFTGYWKRELLFKQSYATIDSEVSPVPTDQMPQQIEVKSVGTTAITPASVIEVVQPQNGNITHNF